MFKCFSKDNEWTASNNEIFKRYNLVTLSFEMPNSDVIVFVQCTYNQGQIVQLNSAIKEYEVIFSDYKEQVG